MTQSVVNPEVVENAPAILTIPKAIASTAAYVSKSVRQGLISEMAYNTNASNARCVLMPATPSWIR